MARIVQPWAAGRRKCEIRVLNPCTLPFALVHFTIRFGALYHSLWCTSPFALVHFTNRFGALHHSLWSTLPFALVHFTIRFGRTCRH